MKKIIHENQKGFLFKNGKFIKMLNAGKYYEFGGRTVEVVNLSDPVYSPRCALEILLADPKVRENVSLIEIGERQLGVHLINGRFAGTMGPGKYAFWNGCDRHEYRIADLSTPEVGDSFPKYLFSQIHSSYFTKVEVLQYQKARLYFDQNFQRILDSGTYYFWKNGTKIDVGYVDTRLTSLNVTGQEILTKDKVSIRVNFVCHYRVTDCVKILTEVDDYAEQLHVAAQLALRDYVGRCRLDEILENKDEMSRCVMEKLKAKAPELFVKIADAGVKDIVLPGEIREIMNTVLVAEKRAQANVITRREEVASTRSLLNTAKLMEENRTLYKLKELEYVERICENVGTISLNGSGDLLSQLTGILRGNAP